MEKGALHGLVSRMDLDLDWTLRHRDDCATLSSSLRVGSVSIPVLLFSTMRCLRGVWNAEVPFSEASVREYPSPVKTRGFSVARWKALVTVSIIPVELCPPSGGAPLISFILDSTSVVSRRETTGEAFLEARSGIQQLSLWEFSSQSHVSLLRNLLSVLVVACTEDFSSASCDVSVSPCELSLSGEQIKCVLSLLTFMQGYGDAETVPYAMRLENYLGVEVTLQDATEQFVFGEGLTLEKRTLSFPDCLQLIDGKRVDHFEKGEISFSDNKPAVLLYAEKVAVLENGEHIHLSTSLQPGTLAQNVTFRTVFHVKNYLSYNISFRSMCQWSEVAMIRPGELYCIPLSCLDSTDVVTRLASIEDNNESRDELLWEESPRKVLEVALSRGEDSIGRLKEFSFAESSAYVDVTYHLKGCLLTMLFAPARPGIHNGTRFPIRVFLYIRDDFVEEAVVDPDNTFVTLRHDPFGTPVAYLFECIVYDKRYVANEQVDLNAIDPAEGECIVMKHEEFPRRHFFELNIESRQLNALDGVAPVYSVVPRYIYGVENNSQMDVEFVSEAGDSIGTLGGGVLSCSYGKNFAYLPLHASLVLRVEEVTSSTFEVNEGLEEQMLLCNAPEKREAPCGSHCFLLRAKADTTEKTMELVPALFIVNMDPTRSLFVQHTIGSKDTLRSEVQWVNRVVLPAAGVLPYTFISCYGYVDLFTFSWEENGEASSYSAPVEAVFSSKTDWSGFVQCGRTQHMVQIHKKGFGDPAMLVVIGPCNRPHLTLVNFTSYAYREVGPMGVSSPSILSLVSNDLLQLSGGDKEYVLRLTHNTSTALDDEVMAFVRHQQDAVTVVLSLVPLNKTVLLKENTCCTINPQMKEEIEDGSTGTKTTVRLDVKVSYLSFMIRDDKESSVLFTVESSEFWMVQHSMKLTALYTMSNASIQSTYKSKNCHVLKPFCFDMTVRDVELLINAISACSAQVNATRLELELSDILLYQFYQLAAHCQDNSWKTMKKKGSKGGDASPAIAVPFISPFSRNRRIEINSVVICEICVILTYDRRVRPPEDVLFRGSPIGTFIPSLHRATIRLPTVRFRDVSRKTLMEVCDMVQEVLFFEFLKQISSFISSVVLFPTLSPLGNILTRVGSFIFGSGGASSELPGAALI
ncbi:hypothetical protein C4B63_24g342 [Trypanosoma cruzi]|uniref:Uncharacterized protein n=1 Tax=Trypanosoma cruzi TaxID=5693 RepID=A0A2V2VKJ3_TRYCR|nr:hypothetical protein C4B63_24g342 [Trypanosoma cruzi]